MKRAIWIFLMVLLTGIQPVWAGDAATKLGRGFSNTAFGWFEIVNEIGAQSDLHGFWIGFPAGLVRGAATGVVRTLVGVVEIVSFPFPNDGKGGYDPIIRPESVFSRR